MDRKPNPRLDEDAPLVGPSKKEFLDYSEIKRIKKKIRINPPYDPFSIVESKPIYTKTPEERQSLEDDAPEMYKRYEKSLEEEANWRREQEKRKKEESEFSDVGESFNTTYQDIRDTLYDLSQGDIWGTPERRRRHLDRLLAVPRGFNYVIGESIKSLGILNSFARPIYDETYGDYKKDPLYALGDWLTTANEGNYEGKKLDLIEEVLKGTGSTLGFMIGTFVAPESSAMKVGQFGGKLLSKEGLEWATKFLGSREAATMLIGGLSQAPSEFVKALEETGDIRKAILNGSINFLSGTTEVLPIEALLSKVTKGLGKKGFQMLLKDMLIQGLEEGSQEMLQQFLTNYGAKVTYDAHRSLVEGMSMSGVTAFLSGALMVPFSHGINKIAENTKARKYYYSIINDPELQFLFDKDVVANPIEKPDSLTMGMAKTSDLKEFVEQISKSYGTHVDNLGRSVQSLIDNHGKITEEEIEEATELDDLQEKVNEETEKAYTESEKVSAEKINDLITQIQLEEGNLPNIEEVFSDDELTSDHFAGIKFVSKHNTNQHNLPLITPRNKDDNYSDLVSFYDNSVPPVDVNGIEMHPSYTYNATTNVFTDSWNNQINWDDIPEKVRDLIEKDYIKNPETPVWTQFTGKKHYKEDEVIPIAYNGSNFYRLKITNPLVISSSESDKLGIHGLQDFITKSAKEGYDSVIVTNNGFEDRTLSDIAENANTSIHSVYSTNADSIIPLDVDTLISDDDAPMPTKEIKKQESERLYFPNSEHRFYDKITEVTNKNQIQFEEDLNFSYRDRTVKNASADATIALAVNFGSAGEILTKNSVLKQGKKYIPIDANKFDITSERVNKIVDKLNSIGKSEISLNIAGNGIFTMKGKYSQEQVDEFTYNLLKAVIGSPNLKTKITSIRTGGQTGFDESGAKAGLRLGIPTKILAPKGWRFRTSKGDISSEYEFKRRFENILDDSVNFSGQTISEVSQHFIDSPNTPEHIRSLLKAFKNRGIDLETLGVPETTNAGEYDSDTKKITLQVDDPYTFSHEVIHRFTVDGLKNDMVFKSQMSGLYTYVKSKITIPPEIDSVEDFVAYGMTHPDFQGLLSKVQYKNTGKTAWREFINTVWNFFKKALGITDREFGQTALTELIQLTTNYIDKAYPIQERKFEEQIKKESEAYLKEQVPKIPNVSDETAISEHEDKNESLQEANIKGKSVRNMSISKIVKDFTDKNGDRIFQTSEQMVSEIQKLKSEAINEQEFIKAFKDTYSHRIEDLESKNKEYIDNYAMEYMDFMLLQMQNKIPHRVAVFSKSGLLVQHTKVFPNSNGNYSSVIYNRRLYRDIVEDVNRVLGKKLDVFEIKNWQDSLKKHGNQQADSIIHFITSVDDKQRNPNFYFRLFDMIRKFEAENSTTILNESIETPGDLASNFDLVINETISNLLFEGEISSIRTLIKSAYKSGYTLLINKTEWLAIRTNSILNPDEITGNAFEDYTRVFNKYWHAVFDFKDSVIDDSKLMKRMAHLVGESPNNLLTEYTRSKLTSDKTAPMYLDGDKLMVRTAQLDAVNIPSYLKKHLEEMLGDLFNDELIGDGAIISLPIVHDMFNLINGNPFTKWGICNKWKNFIHGEQLIKAAEQKGFNSPLLDWMRFNGIGRLILSSARKIKYGQESVSWTDIKENKPIKASQVYTYNMRTDVDQLSSGEVKDETKGMMAAWITTMLNSRMEGHQLQALRNHFKSHVNNLKTKVLNKLQNSGYIAQEIIKYMKESSDLFESMTQQFLQEGIPKNESVALFKEGIDYYKQNILSRKIQETLQHKESRGSSVVLIADLGELTNYKQFSNNPDAFDEYGFIKPGFTIMDNNTFEAIKKSKEIIAACNPPASFADIRALESVGTLPNKVFKDNVYGQYVEVETNSSGILVNIKQFQIISGKDFDIDKIPIIGVHTSELKTLFDFLKDFNGDEKLIKIAKDFESWDTTGKEDYILHENDYEKIKKMIKVPGVKINRQLAHVVKIFGINHKYSGLDLKNPKYLIPLSYQLSNLFIGRLYNVRLFYTAMSEIGGVYLSYKDSKYRISINSELDERNIGLLHALTNMSLDWLSDQKLLTFNFNQETLVKSLFNYEIHVGNKWEKFTPIGDITHARLISIIYNRYLKPSRLLLRKPESADKRIKDYAELRAQMVSAFSGLYTETGKPKLNSNPFEQSTLIKMTRDFFNEYINSEIGVIGMTPTEVNMANEKVRKFLVEPGEFVENLSDLDLLGRIMNRYRDITTYTPFVQITGRVGGARASNNLGGLSELQLYCNMLRERKIYPEVRGIFVDLLRDMFNDRYLIRKSASYPDVVFLSKGRKEGRKYIVRYDGERLRFFSQELTTENYMIVEKPEIEYPTFEDMYVKNIQSTYPVRLALSNIDRTNMKNLTNMFVFGGKSDEEHNSILREYVSETLPFIYSAVAKSEDFNKLSAKDQRLFFKLGTKFYDNEEDVLIGHRYRLSMREQSKSITNPEGNNIKYDNLSPYMIALGQAAKVNENAKQLYNEIIEIYSQHAKINHDAKVDQSKNGKLSTNLYFSKPLSITQVSSMEVATQESLSGKQTINELADEITNNYNAYIKPIDIVDFWNAWNPSKINQQSIKNKHKQFYIDSLAETIFNYKISYDKARKKYNSKKVLDAKKYTYGLFNRYNSDWTSKYRNLNYLGKRLWNAKKMIRLYSNRNWVLNPLRNIIYIHNGKIQIIKPIGIASSFGTTSARPDQPQVVSGAMIASEILRALNDGNNDNAQYYKQIGQDLRNTLTQSNESLRQFSIEPMGPIYRGDGVVLKMWNIAEGSDKDKILGGLKITSAGTIILNGKVYSVANFVERRIIWNIDELTKAAVELMETKELRSKSDNAGFDNAYNSTLARQIMGAIQQRWVYDFFIERQIDIHMNDLSKIVEHASRMSPDTYRSVQAYVLGKGGFLERAKTMKKQIKSKRDSLAKKGLYYMPHMFKSEKTYMKALIRYFVKQGLSQEKAEEKAKEISKSDEDKVSQLGSPKESVHVNFLERDSLELDGYTKDTSVFQNYLETLNLTFRQNILATYEKIYPEYTKHDNSFMQSYIQWQSAIVKTQNAIYRPLQSVQQLSVRQFIRFEFNDRSNIQYGVKWINKKKVLVKGERLIDRVLSGEVVEIDHKTGNIRVLLKNVTDKNNQPEGVIEWFTPDEVRNLEVLNGLMTPKKIAFSIYKHYGAVVDYTAVWNSLLNHLVKLRNYALLSVKPFYAYRNVQFNRFELNAMYGNTYRLAGKALMNEVETIKDLSNLSEPKKQVYQMIIDESTALWGGVNEIMGRMESVSINLEGEISKEQMERWTDMNEQWKSIDSRLNDLYNEFNAPKEEIGWEKKWSDNSIKFIREIMSPKGIVNKFYNDWDMSSFPFSKLGALATRNTKASEAEKWNRKLTTLTVYSFYQDVLDDSYFNEEEKKIIVPILKELSKIMSSQGIDLVDFKYEPGLDLSIFDSTIGGRAIFQFSHFQNMLTSVYLDRFIQSAEQIKEFGLLTAIQIFRNEVFEYTARHVNPVTHEVVEYKWKSYNEMHRAFEMTWKSAIINYIKQISSVLGIGLAGSFQSSIALDIIKLFTYNGIADSMGISVINSFAYLLSRIIESFVFTGYDDDDEKKYYGTIPIIDKDITEITKKKAFQEMFGSSEEEFISLERYRLNKRLGNESSLQITDEMLSRLWKRRQSREIWQSNPFAGVGLADMYTFLMSLAISKGEFDNQMELLQSEMGTLIPGFQITMPLIQSVNPDFMYKSDPVYTASAEIEARNKKRKMYERQSEEQRNQEISSIYNKLGFTLEQLEKMKKLPDNLKEREKLAREQVRKEVEKIRREQGKMSPVLTDFQKQELISKIKSAIKDNTKINKEQKQIIRNVLKELRPYEPTKVKHSMTEIDSIMAKLDSLKLDFSLPEMPETPDIELNQQPAELPK